MVLSSKNILDVAGLMDMGYGNHGSREKTIHRVLKNIQTIPDNSRLFVMENASLRTEFVYRMPSIN